MKLPHAITDLTYQIVNIVHHVTYISPDKQNWARVSNIPQLCQLIIVLPCSEVVKEGPERIPAAMNRVKQKSFARFREWCGPVTANPDRHARQLLNKTRFGPNRVVADMEGNGEFDLKVIFWRLSRYF